MSVRLPIILVVPAALITALVFSLVGNDECGIFPNSDFSVTPFSDSSENGKSTVDGFSSDAGKIVFSYSLRKSDRAPYAGLTFRRDTPLDLGRYDRMRIRMRSTASARLKIVVYARLDGITEPDKPLSYAYFTGDIGMSGNGNEHELELSELKIPDWWYSLNNLKLHDKRVRHDLRAVDRITIENGNTNTDELSDVVTIDRITCERSSRAASATIGLTLAAYAAGIAFFRRRIFASGGKPSSRDIPPHRLIEISDDSRDGLSRLTAYLRDNFADPELSVETTAARTGIPAFKVSRVMRNKYGMTFPQYITRIRIDEAKRLLRETDVRIIEIAFSVGFGNISHFNKIFRKQEGISPKEFRKMHRPAQCE